GSRQFQRQSSSHVFGFTWSVEITCWAPSVSRASSMALPMRSGLATVPESVTTPSVVLTWMSQAESSGSLTYLALMAVVTRASAVASFNALPAVSALSRMTLPVRASSLVMSSRLRCQLRNLSARASPAFWAVLLISWPAVANCELFLLWLKYHTAAMPRAMPMSNVRMNLIGRRGNLPGEWRESNGAVGGQLNELNG